MYCAGILKFQLGFHPCHFLILTVNYLICFAYCNRVGRPCHSSAVSRRLPTAAARVIARVRSCGIWSVQRSTGAGFLRVLRFPLPSISPIPWHSSSSSIIIRSWYNRPVMAPVIVDYVPLHPSPSPKKNRKLYRWCFGLIFCRFSVWISARTPAIVTKVFRFVFSTDSTKFWDIPWAGHDCFFPNTFQFFIHPSSCHLTLYNPMHWQRPKTSWNGNYMF
jgi:hypothetical protein